MRILILGTTGMLGNTLFRYLSADHENVVFGTIRRAQPPIVFPEIATNQQIIASILVEDEQALKSAFSISRPDVIINCIGVVKQLTSAEDPLISIPINALLPHRLARLATMHDARLVHISTDCVFSGNRGNYRESDIPDATDLYGRSKLLGELYSPHTVTLRTSIIGHELTTKHGLLEWFLSQGDSVSGYSHAIFSGLPTVELARVIKEHVIPNKSLAGLYHVATAPISKLELLRLIANIYGKATKIVPSDKIVIDRSLNASRFDSATGYSAPGWPLLIENMHNFR